MTAGTLIVGASLAGVQLAGSLRQAGHPGPITLVGAERWPPYQRPPLSKDFLAGTTDLAGLELRTPEFYRRHGIQLLTGVRVSRLALTDPAAGRGVAATRCGRELRFTGLALTTGARPRRLVAPGADLAGVRYLRDLDDSVRLRPRLVAAARIVVVGGGFLGLEAAAVAAARGASVTVVEALDRLLARAVAPVVSEFYRDAHRRRGVRVRLGRTVAAIHGHAGRVAGVQLDDGTRLAADTVLVGVGAVPRTELAEQLDLACAGGIRVDGGGRTSIPAVVAAGDCTTVRHPTTGEGWVRLESVPGATGQARAAAASLAGRPAPAPEPPWFWSDQFDLKLQLAGLPGPDDRVVVRGDPATERFSVLHYRGDRLTAVHAVNTPADYLAGRAALARGVSVPAELAANPEVRLRDLVPAASPAG